MTQPGKLNQILATIIRAILWLLSWLPGFIMKFISLLINVLLFGLCGYRSKVVKENISKSLPGLSAKEQQKVARRFYQHFSELFLETILIIRLKPNRKSRRMPFANPEMLSQSLEQKQNIIILTGHYGNWEWIPLPVLASGYRLLGVYKPQSSRFADYLMRKIRHKPGIELISMKETVRAVSGAQTEGSAPFALLLIGDQTPARVDIRFWTTFLNQETAFFTGAELIARRYHLPVYYLDQVKHGFGSYEALLTPIYDGVSPTGDGDITRTYTRLLEDSIRKEPYLWLWSHRRWKYHKEELPLQS